MSDKSVRNNQSNVIYQISMSEITKSNVIYQVSLSEITDQTLYAR